MIAPLLPRLAGDLSVSVAAAGQLVTVFALTYALSSPILTALTGALNRRRLLVLSMTFFALALASLSAVVPIEFARRRSWIEDSAPTIMFPSPALTPSTGRPLASGRPKHGLVS
jgi:MFS family permease